MLSMGGYRGIKFASAVLCKTFEKRQAPIQVVSTKAHKGKIVFDADEIVKAASTPAVAKLGGSKKKPRKSPALRKRSTGSASTKGSTAKVTAKAGSKPKKEPKKASPKKKRKSPTRVAKKATLS